MTTLACGCPGSQVRTIEKNDAATCESGNRRREDPSTELRCRNKDCGKEILHYLENSGEIYTKAAGSAHC